MTSAPASPVVAGVDCSPRSAAVLRWADEQARLTGAPLVALTAWGTGLTDDPGDVATADAARHALRAAVRGALPPARAEAAITRVDPADPINALLHASRTARLVALGAHHVHPIRPLGSVPARVIGRTVCPVAVVRPLQHPRTDRVVVGIDGSPASLAALDWALDQALLTGAKVDAVLAWERTAASAHDPDQRRSEFEQKDAWLAARLAALTGDRARPVQGIAVEGPPADVLTELGRGADLVVIGAEGVGPIAARFMGSVSQTLTRRSRTPVVIVPPPARSDD